MYKIKWNEGSIIFPIKMACLGLEGRWLVVKYEWVFELGVLGSSAFV